jgi:hypothetical protein
MLSIRMLDGSTLQARLVAFVRYSVACDILYHNDEKCPQGQRGVVLLKHAIAATHPRPWDARRGPL